MPGGHRPASSLSAGKQPTFLRGYSRIVARGTRLPPLPQQIEQFGREHHIAVLAALRLLDANHVLWAVGMLDLDPYDFARAHSAAITETEQHARFHTAYY